MATSMIYVPLRSLFDNATNVARVRLRPTSTRRRRSLQDRFRYVPLIASPPQLVGGSHTLCDQCCVSNTLFGGNIDCSFYRCDSCKSKSSHTELDIETLYSPGIYPIFSGFQSCVSDTLHSNEYYPDLSCEIKDIQNWNIGSCSAKNEVTLDNSTSLMEGKYIFRGQIISYLNTVVEEYSPRAIWPFNDPVSVNKPISNTTTELLYLISNFYEGAYTGPLMAQCSVSNSVGGIIDDLSIPFAPTEMYKFTDQDDETVHTQLPSDTTEADDPQKFSVLESVDCDESHKQRIVPSISVELSCNATVSSRSDEGEDYCGVSSVAQDDGNLSTTVC